MKKTICEDRNDASKYRKLKSMAIVTSDHIKSGEFFAYEMMAKRGIETTGWFALFLDYLYGSLSGYGQSYKRPIAGLVSLWALFTLWNMIIINSSIGVFNSLGLSTLLSFQNSIPLVGLLTNRTASPEDHESWLQKTINSAAEVGVNIDLLTIVSVTQQFLGAILLFLLLLGLRNAFRLK